MFAIRDDDLSYWTDPKVIDRIYGDFFQMGLKVSFAVIPNAIHSHFKGIPEKFCMELNSERAIGENEPLVKYMRELIHSNKAEIMLHGYNHTYGYYCENGQIKYPYSFEARPSDVKWAPECVHKSLARMHDEILRGQQYLERVFECRVTVFVPPSNSVGRVVRDLRMDLCSATPMLLDRGLRRGFSNWLKHKSFRLFNGYTYPGVTLTKEHKEVAALSLAGEGSDALHRKLDLIHVDQLPAVIATHYWELHENEELRERLRSTVHYALTQGKIVFSLVKLLMLGEVDVERGFEGFVFEPK